MQLIIDKLHLNVFVVFSYSVFIFALCQMALAWSEKSLFPSSFLVDRSFFDYYSFPCGLGILIPTFLSTTVFLYRYIPRQFDTLFSSGIFSNKEKSKDETADFSRLRSSFSKYSKFCNSPLLSIAIFVVVLGIVVWQKNSWMDDGGTAFVDLKYPGYYSLTGIYHTIMSILIYYIVLSIFFRGGATLLIISRIFSRKMEVKDYFEPDYDIEHPDGCCGTRSLGLILVLYYFMLFLLVTQFSLNLVEKLNFYESLQIVLDQTIVSVVTYGFVLFTVCPAIVVTPLLSMHLSLRRYRYSKLLNISGGIQQQQGKADKLIKTNKFDEGDFLAVQYYDRLWDKFNKMPLWPVDFKTISYFVASNFLPFISFCIPLLENWL